MTTQSETIVWHRYPEEKPTLGGNSMILFCETYVDENGDANTDVYADWFIDGMDMSDVIAYADMPVGWKEEK